MRDALVNLGPVQFGMVAFVLLALWCVAHRRVDHALAALAIYLGLLDGYVKLGTGSPYVTLARDVLVIAIAAGALLRSLSSGRPIPVPPLGGFVLAFSAVVLVQFVNPLGDRTTATSFAGLRQHLEFVPLFFLGYAFIRRESQLQKVMLILVVCASVGGVVSYVQSTLTPEQFASWGPGYRERVLGTGKFAGAPRLAYGDGGATAVRPFGLGSDVGGGAVLAALALPSLIALMMAARPALRLAIAPLALGITLAIGTSGTRAAIVTAVVSALAFGLIAAASKNAVRVFAGLAVSVLFTYGALTVLGSDNVTTKRSQSIAPTRVVSTFSQERGSSVRQFGDYVTQYPLGLGIGSTGAAAVAFGGSDASAEQFNSETEWNFLVIEVGLAGLVIFLVFNFRLMVLALVRIRRIPRPSLRLKLAALAAPLFGLLVAGFAGPTTASVPPAPYLWFVAGVLSYWLITAEHSPAAARSGARDRRAT